MKINKYKEAVISHAAAAYNREAVISHAAAAYNKEAVISHAAAASWIVTIMYNYLSLYFSFFLLISLPEQFLSSSTGGRKMSPLTWLKHVNI